MRTKKLLAYKKIWYGKIHSNNTFCYLMKDIDATIDILHCEDAFALTLKLQYEIVSFNNKR